MTRYGLTLAQVGLFGLYQLDCQVLCDRPADVDQIDPDIGWKRRFERRPQAHALQIGPEHDLAAGASGTDQNVARPGERLADIGSGQARRQSRLDSRLGLLLDPFRVEISKVKSGSRWKGLYHLGRLVRGSGNRRCARA